MKTTQSTKKFWLLNLVGWFLYMVFGGAFYTYMIGTWHMTTAYMQLVSFVLIVFACYWLRQFIAKQGLLKRATHFKTISMLLISTFVVALLVKFILSLFMVLAFKMMTWQQYSVKILMASSIQLWLAVIAWTLAYFILKNIQQSRLVEIEKWQLQTALKEAELYALKAQLNPHFIFNCLNNIRAIAIDDGEKTRQMITYLSEILKSSFQFNKQKLVSLEKEIEYLRNYLLLESIQLEERLNYRIKINTQIKPWNVPPMSLQLLVENAIKHGIMLLENGGEITVIIYQQDENLVIDVINDGKLINNNSNGIGLSNLKERIRLLLPKGSFFTLSAMSQNKVKAQLLITPTP
jgi:sensor histidine kinase YesM